MSDNHPKDETNLSAAVIPRLFEEIQALQLEQLQSLPHDLIKITITLGDNKEEVKEGKRWETTPMDIAGQISRDLANSALISSVNHVLWDMNRPLEGDCSLDFFGFDSDQGRDILWHSSVHRLVQALEQEYGCKLCLAPRKTKDEEGFYYDAFYGNILGLNHNRFPNIKAEAEKAAWVWLLLFISTSQEGQPFERIQVTKDQALEMFSDNNFKVEIINDDLAEEKKTVTVYRCGPLIDLCRGPHIPNPSFVKAFKCLKVNRLLDLGQQQDLFFCHPRSPGSWFFLPHGTRVYNKLMEFIKKEYWKRGYTEVISPNIYNTELLKKLGHGEKNCKDNMVTFDVKKDKQKFWLKPMNCLGHCVMFEHRVRSYRELPIRLADFGVLHQKEESGWLTHVRRFQEDDAHIFCRETQVQEEVKGILDFVDYAYTIFGLTYELKLSTRPEKYLGELEQWDRAEKDLEEALNDFGKPWVINKGDGAIDGPKIDITVSDAMKRKFQCGTLQLQINLPDGYKLEYASSDEDETKKEKAVLIHRAVLGSVERMFAILLEQYKGKWPFWLSPRQAIVCSLLKEYGSYADKVRDQIHEAGYYVDVDTTERDVHEKVQEAQVAQYNYILVVGDEEARTGQVTVWLRDEVMSIETLLNEFKLKTANFL